MKHYNSIPRIQDDGTLKGETVWGFNKLDGQNFCASYNCKKKQWANYGSRTVTVDENSEQLGDAVKFFKASKYGEILENIIAENSKKKGVFNGIDEITFFFEWYGEQSFAGKHVEGDDMHLALIDVFLKKKGYIEPNIFWKLFSDCGIEVAQLVYVGSLDYDIISQIQKITDIDNPLNIKEGVVFKRSTLMKGQQRPSVKVKTAWWINKLHSLYSEEECQKLE